MSDNFDFLLQKTFSFNLRMLSKLDSKGLTLSESFITICFLNSLDSADCLSTDAIDFVNLVHVSKPKLYALLGKLKQFGVVKNNNRYDFSSFLKEIRK